MSIIPERDSPADFTTVHEFAQQYRVDASVVRGWIKAGYINYVLVGPRHMRRIRKSDILKQIDIDTIQPIEGTNNEQTGTETTAARTGADASGEQATGTSGDAGGARRTAQIPEVTGRNRRTATGSR